MLRLLAIDGLSRGSRSERLAGAARASTGDSMLCDIERRGKGPETQDVSGPVCGDGWSDWGQGRKQTKDG